MNPFASTSPVVLRPAVAADGPAVARLAILDSSRTPSGPLMLAEVAGRLRAALSITDGHAVADPFFRSGELVAVLRNLAPRL